MSTLPISTDVSPVPTGKLSSAEFQRLVELEGVVERGMRTFVEVGTALLEIKDRHLYREKFATFEVYCHQRWGFGAHRAYQLIDASVVVQEMSTRVDNPPTSERQVRPLVNLDPEERVDAWTRAQENAGDSQPTARQVQDAVEEVVEPEETPDRIGPSRKMARKRRPQFRVKNQWHGGSVRNFRKRWDGIVLLIEDFFRQGEPNEMDPKLTNRYGVFVTPELTECLSHCAEDLGRLHDKYRKDGPEEGMG